ncbi:MAG: hypothetical protein JWQ14_229 [Adhaeribacter sp.]|nr:hypothetical protein [Adhaeribacter sp.]
MLYQRVVKLMGNRFKFNILTESKPLADNCLDAAIAEIPRIEALLTLLNPAARLIRLMTKPV